MFYFIKICMYYSNFSFVWRAVFSVIDPPPLGETFESMASTQQDAAISDISPVLFMTVDGEPMSFFLRPGPVKCKLQPLIAAGGGILSNVQRPGAILLIDPEENGSIPETTAHW